MPQGLRLSKTIRSLQDSDHIRQGLVLPDVQTFDFAFEGIPIRAIHTGDVQR